MAWKDIWFWLPKYRLQKEWEVATPEERVLIEERMEAKRQEKERKKEEQRIKNEEWKEQQRLKREEAREREERRQEYLQERRDIYGKDDDDDSGFID